MRRKIVYVCLSLLVLVAFIAQSPPSIAAHVRVYDRDSLKEELKKNENSVIELMESITIRNTLKVCGNKVLTGPGEIKRAIASESAFGGNLLRVASGSLTLKNITINGRGDAAVLKGKLYGCLVQVDAGQLTIGGGAVLKNNKNSSRLSDGGGAVRVRSGGTCVVNGGSITGNVCITGGAGIRIDPGGVCSVKGGSISGNKVIGKSSIDGFDGRGGGIYNKGTLAIYGGSIKSNSVSGHTHGGSRYGGVGGGIASTGSLLIQGGTVSGNHGSKGADLGVIKGKTALDRSVRISECWLKSGSVLHIGRSYKSGMKLHLIPETVKEGVKLADGLSGKGWKNRFGFPSSVNKKGLRVVLKNGALVIKKKAVKKKKPESGSSPGSGGNDGYSNDGSGTSRVTTVLRTPKPHPSYLPVRPADPMAEIILSAPTASPDGLYYQRSFMPYVTPIPSPTPSASATHIPTPTPVLPTAPTCTPTSVPTPTPVRHIRTLPYYFLFPQVAQAVRPEETHIPIEWRFSVKDIITIKKEIKANDERVRGLTFLRRIRGNIIEREE